MAVNDPGAPLEGWQGVCAYHSDRPREDNVWMLQCGVLVITMNAAFGLFEAGCVGKKNILNIMMKNLGDLTLGGLVWWCFGFRIAFPSFASMHEFPFRVFDESFWFFQWTFAATAATIDSGSLAERVNFLPYCILSMITTGVVYPVAVSWAWDGDGFLANMDPPFMDFAGGALVHMVGGCSALVACSVLGPRIGRFDDYVPWTNWLTRKLCRRSVEPDYYMVPVGKHRLASVTDAVALIWGVFFLWVGWYGFNTGGVSKLEGAGTYVAARIMVNTTMGALGGGFIAFMWCVIANRGKVLAETLSMSVLSGLVSVTAGVYWFEPGASFLIGCMGTMLAIPIRRVLEKLTIDDVVGAVPVHGACGLFGTLVIPFFAAPWGCSGNDTVGLFYARTDEEIARAWKLLGVQAYGCLVIALWAFGVTFAVVVCLNQIPFLHFRVDREAEIHGCDTHEHGIIHDVLRFEEILRSVMHNTCHSQGRPEDIVRIFSHALETLANNEPASSKVSNGKSTRRHKMLTVTITCLEGLEVFNYLDTLSESSIEDDLDGVNLEGKIRFLCEIVNATKLVDEGTYERNYNYFAPRITYALDPTEKTSLSWGDEPLIFPSFEWPQGGVDQIYSCLTLVLGSVKIGQAYIPLYHPEFAETGGIVYHDVIVQPTAPKWASACEALILKAEVDVPPCPRTKHSVLSEAKRVVQIFSSESSQNSVAFTSVGSSKPNNTRKLENDMKLMQKEIDRMQAVVSDMVKMDRDDMQRATSS
eukprot:TRINITY_DN7395_c0_g4_i1.p1 TRINITY_DN7395_c0_g4~~TRINITY_DN7395_c0_g4_i1.p1  ORF type:complete len:756 (+),score=49.04 TRINITY_DN7395_c0_g4_i1:45-2312(+)